MLSSSFPWAWLYQQWLADSSNLPSSYIPREILLRTPKNSCEAAKLPSVPQKVWLANQPDHHICLRASIWKKTCQRLADFFWFSNIGWKLMTWFFMAPHRHGASQQGHKRDAGKSIHPLLNATSCIWRRLAKEARQHLSLPFHDYALGASQSLRDLYPTWRKWIDWHLWDWDTYKLYPCHVPKPEPDTTAENVMSGMWDWGLSTMAYSWQKMIMTVLVGMANAGPNHLGAQPNSFCIYIYMNILWLVLSSLLLWVSLSLSLLSVSLSILLLKYICIYFGSYLSTATVF